MTDNPLALWCDGVVCVEHGVECVELLGFPCTVPYRDEPVNHRLWGLGSKSDSRAYRAVMGAMLSPSDRPWLRDLVQRLRVQLAGRLGLPPVFAAAMVLP